MLLVRRIRELLYNQGFTISGARNRLDDLAHEENKPQALTPETLRLKLLEIAETLRF